MNTRKKTASAGAGARKWSPPTRQQVMAQATTSQPATETSAAAARSADTAVPDNDPSLPPDVQPGSTHAFLFERATSTAGVLRTILDGDGSRGYDGPLSGASAERVAAAVLCGMGEEVAARILAEMPVREQRAAGQAIARAGAVTHSQSMHALEHVRQRIQTGDFTEVSGADYARRLLGRTLGHGTARWIVEQAVAEEDDGFSLLAGLSASQAAPFVWHQHPQTAAAILSQLTAEQAGALLRHFPERQQADVTYRLTTMQDVDASTIERLRASLANILPRSSDAVQSGGARFAAAALTHASEGAERNVLDQMDAQDRMTADAIRGWMFTFEDLSRLSDRELQIWLRQVDQKELVLALKGASEAIQKKILGNMSERVRGFMTEEMGFIGPLPAEEVEAAQLRLMMILRQLEEAGELKIPRHERAFVD